MKRLVLGAIGVVGSAHAHPIWRVCVEKVVVAPQKADGRPWDGPGALGHLAGSVLEVAAESPEEKVVAAAAPAAVELIDRSTSAPDIRVTLQLANHVLVSEPRSNTTLATWGPEACLDATRQELAGPLSVAVMDLDLRDHDLVGKTIHSGLLRSEAFTAQRKDLGPFDGVLALKITLTPVRPITDLSSGEETIGSGKMARHEVTIPAVGTLLLEWTTQGETAGIEGAHDDSLIGYTAHRPDGRILDQLKKHQVGQRRVAVGPGTHAVVFSNAGVLRASARKVVYKFRFQPN